MMTSKPDVEDQLGDIIDRYTEWKLQLVDRIEAHLFVDDMSPQHVRQRSELESKALEIIGKAERETCKMVKAMASNCQPIACSDSGLTYPAPPSASGSTVYVGSTTESTKTDSYSGVDSVKGEGEDLTAAALAKRESESRASTDRLVEPHCSFGEAKSQVLNDSPELPVCCAICDSVNHLDQECPFKTCYRCDKYGHMSIECSQNGDEAVSLISDRAGLDSPSKCAENVFRS